MQRDIEDMRAKVDAEAKTRMTIDKLVKQLELQIGEVQNKIDEQTSQVQANATQRLRASNECSDIQRQLEQTDSQVNNLNRIKSQLQAQCEEAKRALDDETRVKFVGFGDFFMRPLRFLRSRLGSQGTKNLYLQILINY